MTQEVLDFLKRSQNAINFLNSSEKMFERIDDSWRDEFIRLLEKHNNSANFEKEDNKKFVRRLKKLVNLANAYFNPDINLEVEQLQKQQDIMIEQALQLPLNEKTEVLEKIFDTITELMDSYSDYIYYKTDFKQNKFSMEKMLESQLELEQKYLLEELNERKEVIKPVFVCQKPNCKHKEDKNIIYKETQNEA